MQDKIGTYRLARRDFWNWSNNKPPCLSPLLTKGKV